MRPTGCMAGAVWLLAGCLAFHAGPMPGEPPAATFAVVDGVRLRYVDVGQGPAVVLVHGFGGSLETWYRVVPALAKSHRVLALDLKGFGYSDRPPGDYSPAAQARLVLDLMEARGISTAAIVGHSWGASVALAAARMAPDRVTRVALYDAYVYQDQVVPFFLWSRLPAVGELLFGLFYDEQPEAKAELALYDKSYLTERIIEFGERLEALPGTKAAALATIRDFTVAEAGYRTVTEPTLLLWGREDVVTPLSFGERLASELPHARLIVYPRCNHFPMIEAANLSTEDLSLFLAESAP